MEFVNAINFCIPDVVTSPASGALGVAPVCRPMSPTTALTAWHRMLQQDWLGDAKMIAEQAYCYSLHLTATLLSWSKHGHHRQAGLSGSVTQDSRPWKAACGCKFSMGSIWYDVQTSPPIRFDLCYSPGVSRALAAALGPETHASQLSLYSRPTSHLLGRRTGLVQTD